MIELVRKRIQLDRMRYCLEDGGRQKSHHGRNDPREIGVAPAEIRAPVEIVLKERDRAHVAWLHGEVGVGIAQAARLPLAQTRQPDRQRFVRTPRFVQRPGAGELANQRRLSASNRIVCGHGGRVGQPARAK
jgi:hypothetical protein